MESYDFPIPPQGRSAARHDLQPGQRSELIVADANGRTVSVVLRTDRLIEAPNWTPDGRYLVVNADGLLYRVAAGSGSGGVLEQISTGSLVTCNNDHVLSPDGNTVYVSAAGHLYAIPFEGGEPVRVSNEHPVTDDYSYLYYLHGVSPDGLQLAYVAVEPHGDDPRAWRTICTIPAAGGLDVRLTNSTIPADGPEYTPDGEWLWFNWERNGRRPGHSQLFRMRPDGSGQQQMTFDDNVNWFPHISPDGQKVIFLAYAPGTTGHPADVDLRIRILSTSGGEPRDLISFFGGQGSLNVNSWSPDSSRFAYIAYPLD